MTSTLAGTSSSTRTLDQRDLAALRPAKRNAPRPRKPRREPMDRSLTFFCSNPQCDHNTWSPQEQARHMAREFWEVSQALVRLAPESAEALKLTGGVILRDLSDDELRVSAAEYSRVQAGGGSLWDGQMSTASALAALEYARRSAAGTLVRAEERTRHVPLPSECRNGHPYTPENTRVKPDGSRACRTCHRERQRAWRGDPENREWQRAWSRARDADPERRERKAARNRAYRAANRELLSERDRERRARKKAEREAG